MDSWIPLISACIGGLIATIPILIGLTVQVFLHISETRQKRREAKTQLALELMRNDVKIVEDMIDNMMKALRIIELTTIKRVRGELSQEKWQTEILSMDGKFMKLGESSAISVMIAHTLGDKLSSEHENFNDLALQYMEMCTELKSYSTQHASELMAKIIESAAKLHTMLNKKLISIRDN